ncbi:MAG: EamA family transporter [Gammaproteobacteria bacterium]|nr:EamA family transporter [Gammaproteobacteria bacterium]
MNSSRLFDWFALFALVAMFGSAFLLTKIAVQEVPPVMVVAGRIVIGALLLLIISYSQGERISALKPYWPILLALALTGNCIPFFVITWGQQYVDSSLAGILMAMMPLTTVVLAHFFVQGERITKNKLIGFLLGFFGVVILMQPELLVSSDFDWLHLVAMFFILTGAISYAANSIIAHSLPKISLSLISAGVLLMASFVIIPLSVSQGFSWVAETSPAAIWSVILLGVFPSGLATIIYFSVIRRAGAAFLSQINYLIPVWAVLLGILFGGEQMTLNAIVALVVILSGIAIAQKNKSAREDSIYHD